MQQSLLLILLVNLITNPAVVYLALTFRYSLSLWLDSAAGKSPAIRREALYYRSYALTIRHPWLFSLAANGFSAQHQLAASTWMTFHTFKKASLKIVEFLIKRIKIILLHMRKWRREEKL